MITDTRMNYRGMPMEERPSLDGRKAICTQHKGGDSKPVASSWTLPFFEYRPERETDSYYCGCWGWD